MTIQVFDRSVSDAPDDGDIAQRRIVALTRALAELPDIDTVLVGDPRFRWLRTFLIPSPGLDTLLGDAIAATAAHEGLSLLERIEKLEHVRDYANELITLDLEDELAGILAPLISRPDHYAAMMRRLGWDGSPPSTLESAASVLGATREWIRQLQDRIEAALCRQDVWTPILDRGTRILAREAPVPFDQVGTLLSRARLTRLDQLSAESVLSADLLLNRSPRLARQTQSDVSFVVQSNIVVSIDWLETARSAIQRRIGNQGFSSIQEILADTASASVPPTPDQVIQTVQWSDSWDVIDRTWIVSTNLGVRNPLLNRMRKVLAIAPGITLDALHAQLQREQRLDRAIATSLDGLAAFVHWHPDLQIDDQARVRPTEAIPIADALSDSEQIVYQTLRTAPDTTAHATVVAALAEAGFSLPTASAALRTSPIVVKDARDAYRLISSTDGTDESGYPPTASPPGRDEEAGEAAVQRSDVSPRADAADSSSSIDHDGDTPPAHDTPITEAPTISPQAGATTSQPARESDALIADVARKMIARAGCANRHDLNREARQRSAQLTDAAIREAMDTTPGIVWLDENWFTSFDAAWHNPLAQRIDQKRRRGVTVTAKSLEVPGHGPTPPIRVLELYLSQREAMIRKAQPARVPEPKWRQVMEAPPSILPPAIASTERAHPATPLASALPDSSRAGDSAVNASDHLLGDLDDDFDETIEGTIQRMVARTGLAPIESIRALFRGTPQATLVDQAITRLTDGDYTIIDGHCLTTFDPRYHNRLTHRLRRLIAVFPDGCTITEAQHQLARNATTRVEVAQLRSFALHHPEFRVEQDKIMANGTYALNDPNVFWDAELELQRIFANAERATLARAEIMNAHDPQACSIENLGHQLDVSVIIREAGNGRFELITPGISKAYRQSPSKRPKGPGRPSSRGGSTRMPPQSPVHARTRPLDGPSRNASATLSPSDDPERTASKEPGPFPAAPETPPAHADAAVVVSTVQAQPLFGPVSTQTPLDLPTRVSGQASVSGRNSNAKTDLPSPSGVEDWPADSVPPTTGRVRTPPLRYNPFVIRIREARSASGLTQAAAARRLGVSTSYISGLETGRLVPRQDVLVIRLAELYGIPGQELVELAHSSGQRTGRKRRRSTVPALANVRDDRALLDALATPDIEAYYGRAASRLGQDIDSVFAAFDLIPPDIVRWLRGNAERSRQVRALMRREVGQVEE